MFLTIHAALGTLIGQHSTSALLAFILGVISHYLLDIIPHGDEALKEGGRLKKFFALGTLDSIFLGVFVVLLFTQNHFIHPSIIAWGIIGAIIPDITWGLEAVTKTKLFKAFTEPNHFMHQIIKKRIGFVRGIVLQIIFLAVFLVGVLLAAQL